ncbi:1733_t:CDS:2, partial [Gigaspora rosea]
NTLMHLFWMTPNQIENWIQYSNCVLNDITYKTNRYGMALSLFVGFDNNQRNILLVQALLADESLESYIWMFNQLLKSTDNPIGKTLTPDAPYAILKQMIEFIGSSNCKEIWAQYCVQTLLLGNVSHKNAKFHIQVVPKRWYHTTKISSKQFLIANKYMQDQKMLHGAYKKALQMALQDKNKSQDLFNVLQEFINEEDDKSLDLEESSDDTDDNKENSKTVTVQLQNPKRHHGRRHSLGAKRLKLLYEPSNTKSSKN